jgi:tRNA(Ile)-lysidine synthase
MENKKKLSDFFIDRKISLLEKEKTWLLCSGGEIAWIIGHRIDDRFKVTTSTTQTLKFILS